MPTLITRKTARQHMATLLGTITTFVAVYDHEPKNPGGRSPIATIHSDGTRTTFPDFARQWHRLIITLWWKRTDGDATEDYIDDLANEVRQKLIDNTQIASKWADLEFDEEFSEMDYVLLDGTMYRRERIRVSAYIICS